jgi:N-acetylmuramoyl-L-alanine amidase
MRKIVSLILLAGISLAMTGCEQQQKTNKSKSPQLAENMLVNVYYLAGKLGMNITSIDEEKIIFDDALNNVMIDIKQGGVYLNKNYIAPLGRTQKVEGLLLVRLSLAKQIKDKLNMPVEKPIVVAPLPPPPPPKTVELPEPKKATELTGKTIVIDAGHGGKDPGAISYYGFYEKTVNLDVAQQVADILREKGHRVVMTRDSDVFIELEDRAAVANQSRADVFISIHADASARSSTNGFTLYTARSASWAAENLANAIDDRMTRTSISSNGVKQADFRVLVRTQCPAVLVELGYLSNYWEAKQLKNVNMQKKLAQAIADGITNYLNKK